MGQRRPNRSWPKPMREGCKLLLSGSVQGSLEAMMPSSESIPKRSSLEQDELD